jgi:hypothetical protein
MAITFINSVNNYFKCNNLAIQSFGHFQMVLVCGDICRGTGGAHEAALPAAGSLVLQQKTVHHYSVLSRCIFNYIHFISCSSIQLTHILACYFKNQFKKSTNIT